MTERDPRRLLDPDGAAPLALRDALEVAREQVPSDEQLERLAVALGPLLPGGGPGGGGPGGATPSGGGGPGVAAASGSGAAAGASGLAGAAGIAGGKVAIAVVGAALAVAGGATLFAFSEGYGTIPPSRNQAPSAAPATATDTPLTEPAETGTETGDEAEVEAETEVEAEIEAETGSRPRQTVPQTALEEEAETGTDPAAETRLLREAQDALGTAPARALTLAGDHARRFPGGLLAQEREVLAVDALLRLGRRGEAEARAEAFRARWPRSTGVRRLEALLAR